MADSVAKLGSEEQERLERLVVDGGELLKQNRVTEARQLFTQALSIDPNNIKALGLLGLVCFRMNDFQSALPVYERLVGIRKGDASFALNLGWCICAWARPPMRLYNCSAVASWIPARPGP